ncbi:hypothetical protein E2C01_015543 [Portunus trituberculatus]|uniref:Uncharacterized protein n=1 Tax=Portunus trituberculatus TaxID=210409 RepID=A0A5B7DNI1_PORTR|nr:hypothetical protein [Portunus trituberculatus]
MSPAKPRHLAEPRDLHTFSGKSAGGCGGEGPATPRQLGTRHMSLPVTEVLVHCCVLPVC